MMSVRKIRAYRGKKPPPETRTGNVDISILLDLGGRVISASPPRSMSILSRRGAWKGKLLSGLLPAPAAGSFRKALDAALKTGKKRRIGFTAESGGRQRDLELSLEPNVRAGIVLATLKTVPVVPVESDETIMDLEPARDILDNLGDAVMIVNKDMRFVLVNAEACRSLGYTREELIGLHVGDVEVQLGAEGREALRPRIESGERVTVPGLHRRKDGSAFPVEARMGLSLIGGERLVVITARDITDQVRDQEEVLFRDYALRTALTGVAMADGKGFITYVNQAFLRMWGYTAQEEVIGRPAVDFWVRPDLAAEIVERLFTEGFCTGVLEAIRKDGYRFPVRLTSSLVKDARGETVGILGWFSDVTDERKAQAALEESEERFRTVFSANPDGMMIHDIETGEVIDVSDSFVSITGFSRDEAVGRTVVELGLEGDPEQRRHLMDMLGPGGEFRNVEIRFCRKDGVPRKGLLSGRIVTVDGVQRLLATVRDITALKEVEEALRESEERFRMAFNSSPDALLILHIPSRVITEVNDRFEEKSGYARDEVVGKTTKSLGFWKDEGGQPALYDGVARQGRVDNLQADFRKRDGAIMKSLVTAVPVSLKGEPHLLVFVRDITALKETEAHLRSLLEEKDILIKEVHHRVKNNLQVVSGLLNLQAHHISEPGMKSVFRESQNRVITMALIHEELYRARDLAHLDFAQYLRSLAENLFATYGVSREHVSLRLDIEKIQMVVDTAIPVGLVVNELLSNALKHAFPDNRKGLVHISLRAQDSSSYCLDIRDDGVGLPEWLDISQTQSLGLRLVTMLSEQLGGSLTVSSESGTAFRLVFREYQEAGTQLL